MSVSDVASMAGLLEIVVILWKSIHRSMENNKEARVYTINKFASVLPEYLKVFTVRLLTLWVGVKIAFVQNKLKCPTCLPGRTWLVICKGGMLSQRSPGRGSGLLPFLRVEALCLPTSYSQHSGKCGGECSVFLSSMVCDTI